LRRDALSFEEFVPTFDFRTQFPYDAPQACLTTSTMRFCR
jgi:hypothetical protein